MSVESLLANAQYHLPKQYATGWAFVNRMVRDKLISRELAMGHKGYYWTAHDKKVTTTLSKPESKALSSTLENRGDLELIVEQAKDYAWRENSDSLRGFINWLIKQGDK